MAIKTKQEYIESLRQQKPTVYVAGQKIENVVESPFMRTSINNMALGYEWANDPEYQDLFTYWSPLIEEKVSFWAHILKDQEELHKMITCIKNVPASTCVPCA